MSSLAERIAAIKAVLLAEKKKSIAMGVLLVILVVVCIRQFGGTTAPSEAAAKTPVAAAAPVQAPVVTNPGAAAPTAPAVVAPVPVSTPPEKVTISGMPRELSRNLFTTREWRNFRPALAIVQGPVAANKHGVKSSLWGAALSAIVATQREQRKELEETEKVLADMHLQSTMTGTLPMAYISGRLVREGDILNGFSVIQITERHVVVRKGMHLHELVMP